MVVPNDNSLAAATVFNSGVPTFSSVTFQNTSLSTVDDILRVKKKKKKKKKDGRGWEEKREGFQFAFHGPSDSSLHRRLHSHPD